MMHQRKGLIATNLRLRAAPIGALLADEAERRGVSRVVLGWGRKRSFRNAQRLARLLGGLPLCLEDGFLHSVSTGGKPRVGLSLMVDALGIYYDSTQPSELQRRLEQVCLNDPQTQRIRALMAVIAEQGLSKYNHSTAQPQLPQGQVVLVVDQSFGDLSVTCGQAGAEDFSAMLTAALTQHPDANIILKVHPDTLAGRKKGYFKLDELPEQLWLMGPAPGQYPRVLPDCNLIALLKAVDAVYTVTSTVGFEALLLGKAVHVFGRPFYAGWGLTQDYKPLPEDVKQRRLTVEELGYATLIDYSRYYNPDTGQRCEAEVAYAWAARQLQQAARCTGRSLCVDFSFRKRYLARHYLRSTAGSVTFVSALHKHKTDFGANPPARVMAWGTRSQQTEALCKTVGIPLWRMEDGFIRSTGLGSDFAPPRSLIVDDLGIYYDPTRPSRLERILSTQDFSAAECARAAALRETLVRAGVSKYNLTGAAAQLNLPAGRRSILVPGQVEDDASVRLGGGAIQTNAALLQRVRADNPDAWIVYKPHPDVMAGNRRGGNLSAARPWCDQVVTAPAIVPLLDAVDEVHTLTSTTGFEALLRGKKVVVYGQPFYAGWGLTEDCVPQPERRQRRLTLDELVCGVLIHYPLYYDWEGGFLTTPERVIAQILAQRKPGGHWRYRWPRLAGLWLKLARLRYSLR